MSTQDYSEKQEQVFVNGCFNETHGDQYNSINLNDQNHKHEELIHSVSKSSNNGSDNAYENSIEAQNSVEQADDSSENEPKHKTFREVWKNVKSRFAGSSVTPEEIFDFARQQYEQSFEEAEIMKFKASQKLFNPPNEHNNGEKHKTSTSSFAFKNYLGQAAKHVGNAAKGLSYANQRFITKFPPSRGVNVLDKAFKNVKGKATCSFRVDVPHNGISSHHININPKISGVRDPHIKISSGQFAAAKATGKVLNTVNKVAAPVAIALDAIRVGNAILKDVKNGTTRNVAETGASIVGGWSGGYGGGAAGAAIGTVIFPGVGTFVGAVVGGIAGGIGGSIGAEKAGEAIGDKLNYNVVKRKCRGCQKMFKVKLYQGKKDQVLCEKCLLLLLC